MTSRDFVYWLQGYFEILGATLEPNPSDGSLNARQVECIRNHLNMVFKHDIDPKMGDLKHQYELARLHQGGAVGESPKPATQSPSQSIADAFRDLSSAVIKC